MAAPRNGRRVNAVLREEREDVTFAPCEVGAQTGAESFGGEAQLCECVGAVGGGVLVDYWEGWYVSCVILGRVWMGFAMGWGLALGIWEGFVRACEEGCPEVCCGDVDAGDLAGHGGVRYLRVCLTPNFNLHSIYNNL